MQIADTPAAPALDALCVWLAERAAGLDASGHWPAEQLARCGQAGVFRWFLPREHGGFEWSDADVVRGYLKLSAACLTTTFIITQRSGACERIAGGASPVAQERLLPALASGERFATVGISHLTTSRRHLGQPALRARETRRGFVLDGYSAWVTGAEHAQHVVVGATLEDGRQVLLALPTDLPGVSTPPPPRLVALSSSHTGPLECAGVEIDREWLLAGPDENVLATARSRGTGGLQTSTLAIGLAGAALEWLEGQAAIRGELREAAAQFRGEHDQVLADLLAMAEGQAACGTESLRTRANSLVLRSTQAALMAAKGAGFVEGHPTGRWVREALFFLVWSCPQPVANANLCELAGLHD
ncbi:MAG: acyl-CoA dehydrogenase family protein [Pirellulales bacterium]